MRHYKKVSSEYTKIFLLYFHHFVQIIVYDIRKYIHITMFSFCVSIDKNIYVYLSYSCNTFSKMSFLGAAPRRGSDMHMKLIMPL